MAVCAKLGTVYTVTKRIKRSKPRRWRAVQPFAQGILVRYNRHNFKDGDCVRCGAEQQKRRSK